MESIKYSIWGAHLKNPIYIFIVAIPAQISLLLFVTSLNYTIMSTFCSFNHMSDDHYKIIDFEIKLPISKMWFMNASSPTITSRLKNLYSLVKKTKSLLFKTDQCITKQIFTIWLVLHQYMRHISFSEYMSIYLFIYVFFVFLFIDKFPLNSENVFRK